MDLASGMIIFAHKFRLHLYLRHAVLVAILLLAVPLTDNSSWSGLALAQEDKKQEETTQVSGISEKVYRKFAEAQELMEADDYQGAVKILDAVKGRKKLSATEAIQLYRIYGVLYFNQERYKEAIKAFETLLEQEDVSERERNDTLFTLAQLHFQIEDWKGAIKILNNLIAVIENPPSEPFIMLGSAHYQIDQFKELIAPVERAIEIARQRDKEVKERWWLLLRAGYYELNNIPKVTEILEILVVNWPKKEYWTMLSGMYGELDREQHQLGAYESAYDQGLLIKSAEIVTLAQLLMQAEAGYKGARIIEKGFADGIVEANESNYRLLSQAWQMAAEFEKAIEPLKKAAKNSDDGELDVRLANSYLNLSRYEDCIAASRSGLKKGGLKRTAIAQELLGICLFETDKFEDAKKAFKLAAKDKKIKKRTRNWIKFIESEQTRIAHINDAIKQARLARDQAKN
ncbi:MAG: tetratricopeptide repeat protein [Gammaproteobacteria bacterium]|nr:tetratricopeptide repeat protein [Gammaproteobacteria bacterium]